MRIGIDFDNTIACYDGVFYKAAVERGLIPHDLQQDKTSVRDHLRALGRDADFTALQGLVYGARMQLVTLFPGLSDALSRLKACGHDLFIVSHKTRYPISGPAYDLHAAANDFLMARRLIGDHDSPFEVDCVFFELTTDAKISRIANLRCDIFIDDLPEILVMDRFPRATRAILFDHHGHYATGKWQARAFERYRSWSAIADALARG